MEKMLEILKMLVGLMQMLAGKGGAEEKGAAGEKAAQGVSAPKSA